MKKLIKILFFAFVTSMFSACSAEALPNSVNISTIKHESTAAAVTPAVSTGKSGLWIWDKKDLPSDEKGLEAFLSLAAKKGLNGLYLNGHPYITSRTDFKGFKKIVEKAAAHNLKVEILLGNYEWVTDPAQAKVYKERFLTAVADFWKICPANARPALHLDIEPHGYAGWATDKVNLMEKTVRLFQETREILKKSGAAMEINADIPHWLEQITLTDGRTAFSKMYEVTDSLVIMSYTVNPEEVRLMSRDELNEDKAGKVSFAVETNGRNLIGRGEREEIIVGDSLAEALKAFNESREAASIHPMPETNLVEMIRLLPDKI